MLDAPSLVEEDYRRYAAEVQLGEWEGVPGGVIEFVKSLGEGKSNRSKHVVAIARQDADVLRSLFVSQPNPKIRES
jgi:hypothetical protein